MLLLISFLVSRNSIKTNPDVFPVIVSIVEVPTALKLLVFPTNSRTFVDESIIFAGFCLYSSKRVF